jgi:hypothetical protein
MNPIFVTALALLTLSPFASAIVVQKSPSPNGSAVNEAVRTSFGSTVEPVTVFKPYYLTGDFNGDSAQDLVVAVQIKQARSTLPKDVKVLSPWGATYGNSTYPADPAGKPTLALVIIHGTSAGWQTQTSAKFLMLGDSPILIQNYSRLSAGPDALRDLMSVVRRGKLRRGEYLPPTVQRARKGDVIVLGTEAVDSYLYWNGKTYSWEESPED